MFKNDARIHILTLLVIIWLLNLAQNFSSDKLIYPLFSIVFFATLDLLWNFFKLKKWIFPLSSLISGILIIILLHPDNGLLSIIMAVLLAFLSKHYLKIKNRHALNPAAFGVFFTSLIFNLPVSWWMITQGGVYNFIIIISSLTLYKIRRLHIPLIFLAGYFGYFWFTKGLQPAWTLTFDGTVLFFSFIMLPEPITSNTFGIWKYGFSLLALSIFIIISQFHIIVFDPLIFSLLASNLISKLAAN